MLNSWFTIFAQAINFLVLVWLLKRFLYKPILHAIDEREKGIASQLANAAAKVAEGQKEQDLYRTKNEAMDRERANLFAKATSEADAERKKLLDEAQKSADLLSLKRQEAMKAEQENLNQEIARWAQTEVFAVARKVLADLEQATLEEKVCDLFINRLSKLGEPVKKNMHAALNAPPHLALVTSAIDLPLPKQNALEKSIKAEFGMDTEVQFKMLPDLVGGIELSAGGQRIAWSISDYLSTLAKGVGALLSGEVKSASEPAHSLSEVT